MSVNELMIFWVYLSVALSEFFAACMRTAQRNLVDGPDFAVEDRVDAVLVAENLSSERLGQKGDHCVTNETSPVDVVAVHEPPITRAPPPSILLADGGVEGPASLHVGPVCSEREMCPEPCVGSVSHRTVPMANPGKDQPSVRHQIRAPAVTGDHSQSGWGDRAEEDHRLRANSCFGHGLQLGGWQSGAPPDQAPVE